jgi:dihydrofolate reductase
MKAIVCMNKCGGIGKNGKIPWHSKEDMKYFKKLTIGNGNNAVVMGHRTFVSLKGIPLPNRRNYVLTRDPLGAKQISNSDVVYESNIDNIKLLDKIFDEVYVIGGEVIYKLFRDQYTEVYITQIDDYSSCDTYFPFSDFFDYEETFIETKIENGKELSFFKFTKPCENVYNKQNK